MENEERETVELQVDEAGNASVADDLDATRELPVVQEEAPEAAAEEAPAAEEPAPASKRAPLGRNAKLCLAVVAALAVGCAGAAGGMAYQHASDASAIAAAKAAQEEAAEDSETSGFEAEDAKDGATEEKSGDVQGSQASEEAVTWSKRYVLVSHPQKSHEVQHNATYENVTEKHTLCNVCKAEIDGKTDEHAESTGHKGYTTDVPVTKRKVKTEAYTETVVDQEAYTELVEDGEVSSTGEVRNNKYDQTSVTLDA